MSNKGEATFFSAAIKILSDRTMSTNDGYGCRKSVFHSIISENSILNAAIAQSVQELVWNSAQAGMDEETCTASFMGHLASNINWYAMLAFWTSKIVGAKEIKSCNIYWAQQTKRTERWKGADFGIAVRQDDGSLRIALYQAKVAKTGGSVSLHRSVQCEDFADNQLSVGFDDTTTKLLKDESDKKTKRLPNPNMDVQARLHQVHRLEIWRREGVRLASKIKQSSLEDKDWCRYVFWQVASPSAGPRLIDAPTIVSGKIAFNQISKAMKIYRNNKNRSRFKTKTKSEAFSVSAGDIDFGRHVCMNHENDIITSDVESEKLLGNMKGLGLPDFLAVDETSGGSIDLVFWGRVFSGLGLTVSHVAGTHTAVSVPHPDLSVLSNPSPAPKN